MNNGCRHLYYLSPSEVLPALRLIWINQSFAIAPLATGKISVAFLILRIMGPSTWRRRLLYFCIASNLIFSSLAIIWNYVQCTPVEALWDPSVKAKCWKPETQASLSVFNASKSFNLSLLYLILREFAKWSDDLISFQISLVRKEIDWSIWIYRISLALSGWLT